MRVAAIVAIVLSSPVITAAAVAAESVTLSHCMVSVIDEAQVPALEAGQLKGIAVKEGMSVEVGAVLARIDDTRAKMQHLAAGLSLKVADAKAKNNVNIEYARAASAVALAEYNQGVEANRAVPNTVPQAEMRRLLLTYHKTQWEIKQAQVNKEIAGLEAQVSQAELDAAADNIQRRQIKAPIPGMVVQRYRHVGEWVKEGDPVVHIIRMDRLRVEGFLSAADYTPANIDGRPVTVNATLAGNRRETFQGVVVFADPRVQAGGKFHVQAEVDNRRPSPQEEHWLLHPGTVVSMTIQLK